MEQIRFSKNTVNGYNSLSLNRTGDYNTAIGHRAGSFLANDGNNTTSDYSVYLGANTTASADDAQNEVVIGYNAIGAGSNTIQLGNSQVTKVNTSGSLTVNSANPITLTRGSGFQSIFLTNSANMGQIDASIAIGDGVLVNNTIGNTNIAIGASAMNSNTEGSNNLAIGYQALSNNATGVMNTIIGNGADVSADNLRNATAIGFGARVSSNNTIQLGNSQVINVKTSGTITAGDVTYPNLLGTNGQLLISDGSSNLIWSPLSSMLNSSNTFQNDNPIAIGNSAGSVSQGNSSIALGLYAGNASQGNSSIALGANAGESNQSTGSIALGAYAGNYSQGSYTIALGAHAGEYLQSSSSIALGSDAGSNTQGNNSIAIGTSAGTVLQGNSSIALGAHSGEHNQKTSSIALGEYAGNDSQGDGSIALGAHAGEASQGNMSIALGDHSGGITQGNNSIAIGPAAGFSSQGESSIALGDYAGNDFQGNYSIALGAHAGEGGQGTNSIALGSDAGAAMQGANSIAMGATAGGSSQGANSIAIGNRAGNYLQGTNSIALGAFAGQVLFPGQNTETPQSDNSIIINATGSPLQANQSGLFIKPISQDLSSNTLLKYNTATGEITYDSNKTFVINHPTKPANYLVHAAIEGPEAGVYYRGEAKIENNRFVKVSLPDYVSAFANNFTIQITQIYEDTQNDNIVLKTSRVKDNSFNVYGKNASFYWVVYGQRGSVVVEPKKSEVELRGDGPYKYLKTKQ
jgi:hypothetical protein